MGKGPTKRNDPATETNILLKPYGFCCDVKKNVQRLQLPQKVVMPRFLTSSTTNEGPDIKVRFHEEDASPSGGRGAVKGSQRGRSFNGPRGKFGRFFKGRGRGNNHDGNIRGGILGASKFKKRERMKCKRCRGPLKWYLEEEIAVALGIMINKRIEKYNNKMDKNVKNAKKKAKKKRFKKNKPVTNEAKEDTNETDEKTENNEKN